MAPVGQCFGATMTFVASVQRNLDNADGLMQPRNESRQRHRYSTKFARRLLKNSPTGRNACPQPVI